jgi:hypothetical protein
MPIGVVKRFRLASWTATACVAAVVVLTLTSVVPNWVSIAQPEALLALALAWCGAAWLLTPAFHLRQAIAHGFAQRGRLRFSARGAQLGWPIAAGAHLALSLIPAKHLAGSFGDTLAHLRFAGVVLGLIGILLLCILLGRLASWVRDDIAEHAFNFALFGIPITTATFFLELPFWRLAMLVWVVWIISIGALPFGLLSLTGSISWAVHHAREYQDRQQRRAERDTRYEQHVGDTVDTMDRARQQRRARR